MLARSATLFNQSNIDANGHADTWPGAGARLMKGLETMSRCSHCTPMPIGASNSAVRRLLFRLRSCTIVLNRITPRAKTAVNSLARVGKSPNKEATNHDD